MRPPFLLQRTAVHGGRAAPCGEGRDCDGSRHLTALMLFPRLDARPGPWLVLLASVCTYVAIRALELAQF